MPTWPARRRLLWWPFCFVMTCQLQDLECSLVSALVRSYLDHIFRHLTSILQLPHIFSLSLIWSPPKSGFWDFIYKKNCFLYLHSRMMMKLRSGSSIYCEHLKWMCLSRWKDYLCNHKEYCVRNGIIFKKYPLLQD